MAETKEVKDKIVTLETLDILHKHNKETYMPMADPTGNGKMTMNGNATFSGNVNVTSFTLGSKIRLVPTSDSIEIVFLDEETVSES